MQANVFAAYACGSSCPVPVADLSLHHDTS